MKTAIITGGAGAIAGALAKRLSGQGYKLVLVDIDAGRLECVARSLSCEVEIVVEDLSSSACVERLCSRIEATPTLDMLVNNAGVIHPGNVVDVAPEVIVKHLSINMSAPIMLSRSAARVLASRGTGCILSIVSAAALVALPGSAAYSASKFGLRGFLIALSQELAGSGVKVRGVFPGAVDTPMLRYEATHGGSPLNFLNKDVLTVDQVADACLAAIEGKNLETHLPFSDGITARIVCAAPSLMPRLLPMFEKKGRHGLKRFLESRGLTRET